MKRLIIDVDDTVSRNETGSYKDATVIESVRLKMIEYKAAGFTIVLFSSRNMQTFSGNVGRINAVTLPILTAWLDRNEVPYDEIYMGKPWCGHEGFYVDDKAIRPIEFATKSYDEVRNLLSEAASALHDLERD